MRKTLLLAVLFFSPAIFAFTNAYVSFDHPEGWVCERVQGVWICQSSVEPDRRESVVLSIATPATEWDSVENYEDWLKQARSIQDDDGKSYTSEVRYVRKRNVNGHVWVDSLQYNSELPGFWARYVATIHQTPKIKLAVLITYIVSDEHYKQLAPQFERMVSSLKLNQEFDLNIATRQGDEPLVNSNVLGPGKKSLLADRLKKPDAKAPVGGAGGGGGMGMTLMLLLLCGVAGALIVLRIRAKKKKQQAATGMSPTTPQPPRKKTG